MRVKMTEREEGYEIDNTKGANNFPWAVLVALGILLLLWRFFL